jgi:hypothetical protein
MKRTVLDTSVLLRAWNDLRKGPLSGVSVRDVRKWARHVIEEYDTDAIVTPVYIEVIAGGMSKHAVALTRAFLEEFRCVDEGKVLPQDWEEAVRLAQRVPRVPAPRDLGDCLIRAIADRLRFQVFSLDESFPH